MTDCEETIRPALEQAFSGSVEISPDGEDCRVTVPFERSDRDSISLWVVPKGDSYRITDEGETYGMLYLSNINLDQERRAKRLRVAKERFELDEAKHEVAITADADNLGERLIDAIQAVQSISYLSYTRQQYTQSDFKEDVGEFLTEEGFYFTANGDIQGETENHIVDFTISGTQHPTYLDAIHAESTSSAKSIAERLGFKWMDIRNENPDARCISVLDDTSGEYDARTENILQGVSTHYVQWSNRDHLTQILAQ